jgi:thymidylate synthase ThyX
MTAYTTAVLDTARAFVVQSLPYRFTDDEELALRSFFTNLDRRVFFMHALPANIGATLLAMFSRLKNPRGLRGVFVDAFLPQFLATQLGEVQEHFGGDEAAFLREGKMRTLSAYLQHSEEARATFERFLKAMAVDPGTLALVADSKKARTFLAAWLDKYGHNSIARMAGLWLCCEGISLLAAKTIEWNRPGSGFIELSTRYVDMSHKGCYPIEQELLAGGFGHAAIAGRIKESSARAFSHYKALAGDNFDGPFPEFLREQYAAHYEKNQKDLDTGVIGETCDVLGNLLPSSVLTSVGVHVSGEAFPMLLKHLFLDATPENLALAHLILDECRSVGGHQFARHYEPTLWDHAHWQYCPLERFLDLAGCPTPLVSFLAPYTQHDCEDPLVRMLGGAVGIPPPGKRGDHDKLPAEYEAVTLAFRGLMTFRGWRDLQRQGFCTHHRTFLTPRFGFYAYDKPALPMLRRVLQEIAAADGDLYQLLRAHDVPEILCQYPLALGNRVGFTLCGNLRQLEFCTWQRTAFSVNHEVRQVFLEIERNLRGLFPWWSNVSRADGTPAYIFARGDGGTPLTL